MILEIDINIHDTYYVISEWDLALLVLMVVVVMVVVRKGVRKSRDKI
ncbi:hypothetical protein [Phaeocystidibacter luteus]|nr:hypothetical protein [Phaeocystidibacter luteus]